MEEKKFFEAFPTLKISKELSGIFAEGVVYHITMNSSRTQIKIYIKFTRLIGRDVLNTVENEIKRQIKPFIGMKVTIIEKFKLSSLYTPQIIMDEINDFTIEKIKKV